MRSIADSVTLFSASIEDIKAALAEKEVEVPEGFKLSDLPGLIERIGA